VISNYNFTI